ncbi:MAG: trigger factor [Planctomycetota bacterium]|nr:trigger factor [Planctomycetota bacterium]
MTDLEVSAEAASDGSDDTSVSGTEQRERLSLDVAITSPSTCQRHVTVVIPREDIDRYLQRAIGELMPSASVPGFRPGRAPRKLVLTRFKEHLADQVKGSLLLDSMTQITEESSFAAISEPDFDFEAVEVPDEGPMKFEFDVEVRPEFDLPEWKGVTLERPVREVLDRDVDMQLEQLLGEHGTLVPQEEPAKIDDFVVVNMVFRKDGDEISRLEEETIRVKPALSFPDGNLSNFGELLRGAKAGDTRKTHIHIVSDAAVESLQGQKLDVEIEVLDVKRMEISGIDEQALERLGYTTEAELREAVRSQYERKLQYFQQQQLRSQITDRLVKTATWDLPPDMLKRQSSREMQRQVLELQRSGFDEDYIQARQNELRRNVMATTAKSLKEHFIFERIAESEKIEPSETDYSLEYQLIAAQSGESVRRVRSRIEKRGLSDVIRNQITERMVVSMIMEHAKSKDVPFEPQASAEVAVDHSICGANLNEIPEAKYSDNKPTSIQQPLDRS